MNIKNERQKIFCRGLVYYVQNKGKKIMAIAPISSVSFRNNYNQVNFEGKKESKNDGYTYKRVTNTLKSIPVAALIAMSPLVAQAQNQNKVVATANYPTAFVEGDEIAPGYLEFVSTDGNDADSEKLLVTGERRQYETIKINGQPVRCQYTSASQIQVDTLACEITTREYRHSPNEVSKKYYIYGPLKSFSYNYTAPDGSEVIVNKPVSKFGGRMEISKDFYDWLTKAMGDEVEHKTTNETIDGSAELDKMYGF